MFYLRQPAEKKKRKTKTMNKPEPTTNAKRFNDLRTEFVHLMQSLNTSYGLDFNYNLEPRFDKTSLQNLDAAYDYIQQRKQLVQACDIIESKLRALVLEGADKEWFAHQRDLNAYWYARETAA